MPARATLTLDSTCQNHCAAVLETSNREQTRQSRSDALRTVQGIVVGRIIKVGRRARSVRRGCGRWPLAKAHDRGESNQHPALLERQDYTLVTWYRSLYAPRTGGAYDSHHRK